MLYVTPGQGLLMSGGKWCGTINHTQEARMLKENDFLLVGSREKTVAHFTEPQEQHQVLVSKQSKSYHGRGSATTFIGVPVGKTSGLGDHLVGIISAGFGL